MGIVEGGGRCYYSTRSDCALPKAVGMTPRIVGEMVDNHSQLVVKCAELRYYDFR